MLYYPNSPPFIVRFSPGRLGNVLCAHRSAPLLLTILTLLLTSNSLAAAVSDGIYSVSDTDTAQSVLTTNGSEVFLGHELDIPLRESFCGAQNNSNDSFILVLTYGIPLEFRDDYKDLKYVLVIDNRGYLNTGLIASIRDGTSGSLFLSFVVDESHVDVASNLFNSSVHYRKHPGHQLLCSFEPLRRVVKIGEPVYVTMRITNLDGKDLSFNAPSHPGPNKKSNRFRFVAEMNGHPICEVGGARHAGIGSLIYSLKPGESWKIAENLANWFEFDRPGEYTITGMYLIDFAEPNGKFGHLRQIWSDHVSATFSVQLE